MGALIAWAFSHAEVSQVIAETLPDLRPSIRVMVGNGMRFLGKGSEEGVIRYGITREEFLRR
jgi:RimJ/RimL family protein N-acetyltransferase